MRKIMIENETKKSPKNFGSRKKSVEKKFSKSDVLKTNVIPGKSKFGRYQFRECKNANLRITTYLRTYNSGNKNRILIGDPIVDPEMIQIDLR